MPKVRSPNYPTMPLGAALEAIRPAFRAENRNKMARSVLAGHLGYTSLNGRALSKIGAVRSYGLIEGSGDELRISDDAVVALNAPAGSTDRTVALARLGARPSLFQELRKDYPDTALPSVENLRFNLIKRGYTQEAAGKAAENYLATMSLVAGVPAPYNPPDEEEEEPEVEERGKGAFRSPPPPPPPPAHQKVNLMAGERELTAGLLSREANFRLIVSGPVGVKEIDRLIAKLELDKEILAESDDEPDEDA